MERKIPLTVETTLYVIALLVEIKNSISSVSSLSCLLNFN